MFSLEELLLHFQCLLCGIAWLFISLYYICYRSTDTKASSLHKHPQLCISNLGEIGFESSPIRCPPSIFICTHLLLCVFTLLLFFCTCSTLCLYIWCFTSLHFILCVCTVYTLYLYAFCFVSVCFALCVCTLSDLGLYTLSTFCLYRIYFGTVDLLLCVCLSKHQKGLRPVFFFKWCCRQDSFCAGC